MTRGSSALHLIYHWSHIRRQINNLINKLNTGEQRWCRHTDKSILQATCTSGYIYMSKKAQFYCSYINELTLVLSS